MNVLPLVKKLFPYAYSITGKGNDDSIEQYLSELPFTLHEYSSGQQLNGWHIPHAWQVEECTIYKDNKLIYDAKLSPLGVGILSPSFNGTLSLTELKAHLVSDDKLPEAILYHWQNLYRPLDTDWAICMPHELVEQLTEGDYKVTIATSTKAATMKVLDFNLAGESKETIILNGHNCHPFQANDDISGCAVAIRVIQKLMVKKKCFYSYRIMIAPELHGPMFWLENINESTALSIKGVVLLKSVGNQANMRLQHSYNGNSAIDNAATAALSQRYKSFESGEFRAIYGNDETIFEAPPYNIPTISLTRWPFAEYHSDLDTPEILDEQSLQDSVDLVIDIIEQLEIKKKKQSKYNQQYKINFKGLVCLSAYGLYKSIPAVNESGVDYSSLSGRWNRLMNCLPREIDNSATVFELSQKYHLPCNEIQSYLEQWVKKDLLIPIATGE